MPYSNNLIKVKQLADALGAVGTLVSDVTETVADAIEEVADSVPTKLSDLIIDETAANGTTFTPAVSNAGVISWSNDGGKQNPASVDLVAAVLAALPTWNGGAY